MREGIAGPAELWTSASCGTGGWAGRPLRAYSAAAAAAAGAELWSLC